MITKQTIQEYAFHKPEINFIIYTIPILVGIFALMLATSLFLEGQLQLVGFIGSGFLIGVSLSLTRNIFFPIGIVISYNLTIIIESGLFDSINLFETIFRSIVDALFIIFVIFWVIFFSQYVMYHVKGLKSPKDEPVTINKFILGSIVSGIFYGIFMIIQEV